MRRCTGATLLREATSELAPLTTAQLSAPSSIRGCPMSTRPGPKRGLASSLRVHARSTRAQGPCDARAVRATTCTAPSCVRAGLSYRTCSRWRPRPFPALDGGRKPGPKRGLASSLRVHARSTRAQEPCDARAVRATTCTAPSCVRAGLSYRTCSRWRPRPFPALDGGRAAVTRVDRLRSPGTPSSSSSS